MPNVIILTAEQADEVRGPALGAEFHTIMPIELTDGTFYVGTAVRDDPVHIEHHDLLASCPEVDFEEVKDKLPDYEEAT